MLPENDAIATRLSAVLQAYAAQGAEHLGETRADLQQTSDLLAGAIEKLTRSFLGIHAALCSERALIQSLAVGVPLDAALKARLLALQDDSTNHVNAAVTGLQFQDMTSQLLGRMSSHVQHLADVLGAAGAIATTIPAQAGGTATLAALDAIAAVLAQNHAQAHTVARRAVAQTHMDSGDIELF